MSTAATYGGWFGVISAGSSYRWHFEAEAPGDISGRLRGEIICGSRLTAGATFTAEGDVLDSVGEAISLTHTVRDAIVRSMGIHGMEL
jgi:hypothetical protein